MFSIRKKVGEFTFSNLNFFDRKKREPYYGFASSKALVVTGLQFDITLF